MLTDIDSRLLEKIADLTGKPVGAFNIRKDSGCEARQSTEHIEIVPQPEGKSGIIIRVKAGTKGEQCHIPVIISKTGLSEMVYNDFYIGEDCDVDIVAGCGIHNSGCDESRHDGVHTFYVGKNSHVHYSEKHYGEGDGNGKNVMNPQTIVYLEEGASIQMDTVQIRGIDSTKRYTKIVCGKDAEGVVTERLLTHGHQEATSDMEIVLDGENSRGASFPAPSRRTGPASSSIPAWSATRSASVMCSVTPSSWAARRSAPFPRSRRTPRTPSSFTRPPSARSPATSSSSSRPSA